MKKRSNTIDWFLICVVIGLLLYGLSYELLKFSALFKYVFGS